MIVRAGSRRPAPPAGRRFQRIAPLVAALVLAASGPAFAQQDAAQAAQGADLLPQEREVVRLVNGLREGNGLRPLHVNAPLCRAARRHAENMAAQGRMSHVLDGKDHIDRARAEGFMGPVAEDIGSGSRDEPGAIVDLWAASPAHRANMLRGDARELGVGFARSVDGVRDYWVTMFGALP